MNEEELHSVEQDSHASAFSEGYTAWDEVKVPTPIYTIEIVVKDQNDHVVGKKSAIGFDSAATELGKLERYVEEG